MRGRKEKACPTSFVRKTSFSMGRCCKKKQAVKGQGNNSRLSPVGGSGRTLLSGGQKKKSELIQIKNRCQKGTFPNKKE